MACGQIALKLIKLPIDLIGKTVTTFIVSNCRRMSTLERETNLKGPGLLKILENNPKRLKRIKFLGKLFESNSYELRVAGGAVRDILTGKEPQDIDFATTARPDQSLEILSKHEDILRIIVTASGQRHGTVAVKFKEAEIDFKRIKLSPGSKGKEYAETSKSKEPEYDEESPYEITTLRCDKFTDGRHAEVEFINDWRIDAERRDLTINAMFLTLDDGKLIDYFNGENDLKNGIVKFVGDADSRLKEDYLRILRFFRFWSRYGRNNQPDPDTMIKLQRNLEGLNKISGERIWQEIKKILSYLPCLEVIELMLKLRLFNYAGLFDKNLKDYDQYCQAVLDEIKFVQENVKGYLDNFLDPNLQENLDNADTKKLRELVPVILFASTIQTEELCLNAHTRLKFSNLERETILYIIENRQKDPSIRAFKHQLATCHAPERPQMLQRMKAYLIAKGKFSFIDELESWEVPHFPVSGTLVAQAFRKHKLPGNMIKVVLESLKFDWAKSDYKLSKEELMEKLQTKVNEIATDHQAKAK